MNIKKNDENNFVEYKKASELTELSNDIKYGRDLLNMRRTTNKYILDQYGKLMLNNSYIKNENQILDYINKINDKYKKYIELYKIVLKTNNQLFVYDIETYLDILNVSLASETLGESISNYFNKGDI